MGHEQKSEGLKTFIAGEDLATYCRVKADTTAGQVVYADAGEDYIGITEYGVSSGDPVAVRLKTQSGTCIVTAAGAFSIGDDLYGAADGKVDDTPVGPVQFVALEAASTDGDYKEAVQNQAGAHLLASANYLWVDGGRSDTYDANGTIWHPYQTITAGLAATTSTRNEVLVKPGAYTEAATLALPTTHGVSITGVGGEVEINAAVGVGTLITIAPGTATATTEYKLKNLYIACVETSQLGIQIDNVAATHKCILHLTDCAIEEDSGTSIDIDHAGTPTVRVYIHHCEVEGSANVDIGSCQDRYWAEDSEMWGLLTAKGDNVAASFKYERCRVNHTTTAATSTAGTNATFLLNRCMAVTRTTDDSAWTYAKADSDELGSSKFTETIID